MSKKDFMEKNWKYLQHVVWLPFVLSLIAILFYSPALSKYFTWVAAGLVAGYVFFLLCRVSLSADRKSRGASTNNFFIPTRIFSFFMLISFILVILLSFSVHYVRLGREMTESEIRYKADTALAAKDTAHKITPVNYHFNESFVSRKEAFYFSAATMLTLGYGDKHPKSSAAKCYVLLQLVCAFLIFFGIFPLFISRIVDFSTWTPDDNPKPDLKFLAKALKNQTEELINFQTANSKAIKSYIKYRITELANEKNSSQKVSDENINNYATDIKTTLKNEALDSFIDDDIKKHLTDILSELKK